MNKRTAVILIVLAAIGGAAFGGVIGFIWHAPGRPSTWTDVRDWLTSAVLVLGFPAAVYQLYLQRRQFADEAARNVARDDLLDRQRRELQQRERLRDREQAEGVGLTWRGQLKRRATAGDLTTSHDSTANVTNDSRRPIRDVACQLDPGNGSPLLQPEKVGELIRFSKGPRALMALTEGVTDCWRVAGIRPGENVVFTFGVERDPVGLILLRFTDDAGLHWQLDHHLHLTKLEDRDW